MISLALLLAMPMLAQNPYVDIGPVRHRTEQDLIKYVYSATALLYRQASDGDMEMTCTVTAFEKTDKGYLFVTASHCVSESDETHERVDVMKTQFFITFDEKSADKKFYKAKLLMAGYQPKGDDFSILSVDTTDTIPVVSLGDEKLDETGLPIINVASPNGLGKQVFHGSISSLYVDRPFIQEDINWQGVMLLQVQLGPGSSGSAIVSTKQEAIIGFLVGHQGGNSFAMPVSRFKVFRQAVLDGKYKYFNKDSYNEVIPATKGAAAVPKP